MKKSGSKPKKATTTGTDALLALKNLQSSLKAKVESQVIAKSKTIKKDEKKGKAPIKAIKKK